jgi:ribonuclease J
VERLRLGFAGLVSVAIVLSDTGDILEDAAIALVGVPATDAEGTALKTIVEDAVDDALDGLSAKQRRDAGLVVEAVRRAVRAQLDAVWGKKPPTLVHVVHVAD